MCVYTCRHRRKGTRSRANDSNITGPGLHACVGRVEGSLFPLAASVCVSGHVGVVPTLFRNPLTCYTSAFSSMDIWLALDRSREDRREMWSRERMRDRALNFGFQRKRSEDRFIRFMEIFVFIRFMKIEIRLSFSRNFNNNNNNVLLP